MEGFVTEKILKISKTQQFKQQKKKTNELV